MSKDARKALMIAKGQVSSGYLPSRHVTKAEGGEVDTYRGYHEAPDKESGAPMHDVRNIYPSDVYGPNGYRYYGDNGHDADAESWQKMMSAKGRPYMRVEVYRAVPKDKNIKEINAGDWVTSTKQYAKDHGEGALNGNYKIIKKTVKAKDIYTNGDSHQEWGYHPSVSPTYPKRIEEINDARSKFDMPPLEPKYNKYTGGIVKAEGGEVKSRHPALSIPGFHVREEIHGTPIFTGGRNAN